MKNQHNNNNLGIIIYICSKMYTNTMQYGVKTMYYKNV